MTLLFRRLRGLMNYERTAPLVILSPHLDDAVYSAWSVLRRPEEVQVANFCTASPPLGTTTKWDRIAGASDSAAFVGTRREEDARALALAKRTAVNLGFLDVQYRGGGSSYADPNVPRLQPRELRDRLQAIITKASGIFAPAGLGGHADHIAVRALALELFRDGFPTFLYADMPYAVHYGWPHWVSGEPKERYLDPDQDWEAYLSSVGGVALEASTVQFSDEEALLKLAAMETYKTQFPSLNGGPADVLRNPRVNRFEVLWSVAERV